MKKLITVLLAEIMIKTPSISKGDFCLNIFKVWNAAIHNVVFTYPGGQGTGGRGRTNFAVTCTRQIAFLSVKAHGKNAHGFMYFWQQERTLVYKAVQLWNIQCSLLCVRWSFASYQSSDSTLTTQIAMCYLSEGQASLTAPWDKGEKYSSCYCPSNCPPSGRPGFSQQNYQNGFPDTRRDVQPLFSHEARTVCFESHITNVAPKRPHHTWVCGKVAFVCGVLGLDFFPLFGLLKWYLFSLSLVKELKILVNFCGCFWVWWFFISPFLKSWIVTFFS